MSRIVIKRDPPLNFRPTNHEMRRWLLSQPNRSRVINDALKIYMGNAPWRNSDTANFKALFIEFRYLGRNINQIARAVNVANLSGQEAKGLDQLMEGAKELRRLNGKISALIRLWHS